MIEYTDFRVDIILKFKEWIETKMWFTVIGPIILFTTEIQETFSHLYTGIFLPIGSLTGRSKTT